MDMEKAREVVRERIETHRNIEKMAYKNKLLVVGEYHKKIADAMELVLEGDK